MRLLIATLVWLGGCAEVTGGVTLLSDFEWTNDHAEFGGVSGIEVLESGNRFVAVNDSAHAIGGEILRKDGSIIGVNVEFIQRLLRASNEPLAGYKSDAEGLALGPNGRFYVSFEQFARIANYDDITSAANGYERAAFFRDFQSNSSLEAVAVGPDGAVYTMPERSGRATRPFPVYRLLDGTWSVPFSIPRRGAYLVVGADVGPDHLLYLLERDFTGIGFRTRVRRFDLMGKGETVLLETANGTHDNLEGLSVWVNAGGQTVLTMVSDDNFKFFQRTEIVEYVIDR